MITSAPSTPPGQSLEAYHFPSHRLRKISDPSKTPLVLVACGSFSPITNMHLRMFEMAADHVKQNMAAEFEVIGGYLSPVSDRYNKAGLASAAHRYPPSFAHRVTPNTAAASACVSLPATRPRPGSWSTPGKPYSATTSRQP